MDHLLLHCEVAYALWSDEFWMLGVYWVMPPTVTSLLCGWRSWFVKRSSGIWNMVPSCLMWLVLKEHNSRTFEYIEKSLEHLKSYFLRTVSVGTGLGIHAT